MSPTPPYTTWNQSRSGAVAFALWLFLGTLGIHRAYLNRQGWLAMFLAGLVGWLISPIGLFPPAATRFGALLLLVPVGLVWLADGFRLFGWVADHNALIGLRTL